MGYFKIGAMADSFRLPIREALKAAADLGVDGVQMYAVKGEVSAEGLDKQARKELDKYVKSLGIKVSALCGDFGQGLYDDAANEVLLEKMKRVLELANDLDTKVVTTHIGVVPDSPDVPRFEVMQRAARKLAKAADDAGVRFAVETGPETSLTLKNFLDTLGSKGISVNLDPANLVMVTGDDPVQAVYNLKDYIVHTHAKDGKMLNRAKPEVIYGLEPAPKGMLPPFIEVPLGTGSVDFPKYLAALKDIGYNGFLTIEREVGENPAGDIATAVNFLRDTMKGM